MENPKIFSIHEYRKYKQIINDLPKIITIFNQFETSLNDYKHYNSANEVLFYLRENKTMLESQLKFFKAKIQDMKGDNINGSR